MVFSFIKNLLGGGDRSAESTETPATPPPVSKRQGDAQDPEACASTTDLEDFVRFVTKALVDNPDDVMLQTVDKGRNTTINITCAKSDMGKIIARSGKTISAIRALAAGAAGKAGRKVSVEVSD
jgi:predicted RNA-binding protein YlqC (UPF0109 family)